MVSDESKSTQKIHYTQGQHSANIKRHAARTAEDCAAFVIPYLNKLPSNFKYLDLGCGPGSITVDLAQQYPQATFIGVDSGEKILEHAHALVKERGVENVTLLVGDLLDLDAARNGAFEWGSFDVVYCHQVLNHMQKPVDGLKVMRRAAKANGGIVAARESFSTGMQFYPEIPGTRQYINLLFEVNKQNGSDPDTGKKLIKLAMEAGWKRTQINGLAGASPMNTDAQRRAFAESAIEACRDTENHPGTKKLIELGLATKSELEGFANDWQEWLDDEGGWMTMVNGEIICTNSVE